MPQTLKKQALTLTIANGFTRGLGFLFRLMTARLMGAEAIGVMELSASAASCIRRATRTPSRWIFLRKRRFNWSASTRKTRRKSIRKLTVKENIPSDKQQAGCFRIHFSSGFGSFPTHQPRSLLTLRSTASRLSFHGSA